MYDPTREITSEQREKIYEEIWSEPIRIVAPRYGLSDVAFRKRCINFWDIPVPEVGYWAKKRAGKAVVQPKLPVFPTAEARKYVSGYAVKYYCDVLGFKEIKFDESAAHKPDNLMRVVYVEPHMPAYVTSIPAGLKGYQQAVSGYIEVLYNDDDTALICNEEAKLIGMEGNRHYGNGGVIAGSFFVIGLTEDDFRSLTNGEVRKYLDKYAEPEDISPAEVQADTGFQVIGFF